MSIWRDRRRRVVQLLGRQPHAEEILTFYGATLEAQEYVGQWVGSLPSAALEAPTPEGVVEDLEDAELRSRFSDFCARLTAAAPPPLAEVARWMVREPAEGLTLAMATALDPSVATWDTQGGGGRDGLSEGPFGEVGEEGSLAPDVLSFFGSAFLEPVAVAGRHRRVVGGAAKPADPERSPIGPGGRPPNGSTCAYCGRAPVVATLEDRAEAKGLRLASCGFCAHQWPERRAACLACGERDTARLMHHVSDSLPHVRVEECESCRGYHKTVDLRIDGRAVPVVDELASVELDLWARERGLSKLRLNLLGL